MRPNVGVHPHAATACKDGLGRTFPALSTRSNERGSAAGSPSIEGYV
ncbi:MAG TPA: hypothetical protein V6D19_18615 [Stenomitos sp.]